MTSKEFIRRFEYWFNWLSAFESFSNHPEFLETDLGFFKSFLFKLKSYQLAVLQQDSRFTHILNYLSNERKK